MIVIGEDNDGCGMWVGTARIHPVKVHTMYESYCGEPAVKKMIIEGYVKESFSEDIDGLIRKLQKYQSRMPVCCCLK